MSSGVGWIAWVIAVAAIAGLLTLDLVEGARNREAGLKEALRGWLRAVVGAAGFGAALWWWRGASWAGQFFAGYLTEAALSVDNLFVFAVIFATFSVAPQDRPRVLQWGVVGALVARAVLIGAGVGFIDSFWWATYVLGAIVVASGVRIGWPRRHREPGLGPITMALAEKLLHLPRGQGSQGTASQQATMRSLVGVVVLIELTDIAFALDSVPAVLGLTRITYIVFSSNAFAILGLRSLFFVLDRALERLRYLHVGLAVIMVLVGARMLVSGVWEAPLWLALAAIATTLAATVLASVFPARPGGEGSPGRL